MKKYQAPQILLHQDVVFENRWGSGYKGSGSGKGGGKGSGKGSGWKPPWW